MEGTVFDYVRANPNAATKDYLSTNKQVRDPDFGAQSLAVALNRPTLTTIPVPGAVWLFGTGLLGLIGLARRKKA